MSLGLLGPAVPPAVAGYPVRPVTFESDALQVRLVVVDQLEDYVDRQALLRDPQAPEPPYWAHIWPGSRCLARLMSRVDCVGRCVVDIGCGLGLAGIVPALRGASVTMIDTAPEGVQFARANAELNGLLLCSDAARRRGAGSAVVLQSDIRYPAVRGQFDYVLAADVTYDPLLQSAVAMFLVEHLAAGGRAWCAESVRTFDQVFRRTCEAQGLWVTESEMREPDEEQEVPVRLTEVRWP